MSILVTEAVKAQLPKTGTADSEHTFVHEKAAYETGRVNASGFKNVSATASSGRDDVEHIVNDAFDEGDGIPPLKYGYEFRTEHVAPKVTLKAGFTTLNRAIDGHFGGALTFLGGGKAEYVLGSEYRRVLEPVGDVVPDWLFYNKEGKAVIFRVNNWHQIKSKKMFKVVSFREEFNRDEWAPYTTSCSRRLLVNKDVFKGSKTPTDWFFVRAAEAIDGWDVRGVSDEILTRFDEVTSVKVVSAPRTEREMLNYACILAEIEKREVKVRFYDGAHEWAKSPGELNGEARTFVESTLPKSFPLQIDVLTVREQMIRVRKHLNKMLVELEDDEGCIRLIKSMLQELDSGDDERVEKTLKALGELSTQESAENIEEAASSEEWTPIMPAQKTEVEKTIHFDFEGAQYSSPGVMQGEFPIEICRELEVSGLSERGNSLLNVVQGASIGFDVRLQMVEFTAELETYTESITTSTQRAHQGFNRVGEKWKERTLATLMYKGYWVYSEVSGPTSLCRVMNNQFIAETIHGCANPGWIRLKSRYLEIPAGLKLNSSPYLDSPDFLFLQTPDDPPGYLRATLRAPSFPGEPNGFSGTRRIYGDQLLEMSLKSWIRLYLDHSQQRSPQIGLHGVDGWKIFSVNSIWDLSLYDPDISSSLNYEKMSGVALPGLMKMVDKVVVTEKERSGEPDFASEREMERIEAEKAVRAQEESLGLMKKKIPRIVESPTPLKPPPEPERLLAISKGKESPVSARFKLKDRSQGGEEMKVLRLLERRSDPPDDAAQKSSRASSSLGSKGRGGGLVGTSGQREKLKMKEPKDPSRSSNLQHSDEKSRRWEDLLAIAGLGGHVRKSLESDFFCHINGESCRRDFRKVSSESIRAFKVYYKKLSEFELIELARRPTGYLPSVFLTNGTIN